MFPKMTLASIIRILIRTGNDQRTGDMQAQHTCKKREKEVICQSTSLQVTRYKILETVRPESLKTIIKIKNTPVRGYQKPNGSGWLSFILRPIAQAQSVVRPGGQHIYRRCGSCSKQWLCLFFQSTTVLSKYQMPCCANRACTPKMWWKSLFCSTWCYLGPISRACYLEEKEEW